MAIPQYDTGNVIRCACTFKDIVGTLTDPTTVTFKYRDPSTGNETSNSAVKDSTGTYHFDLAVNSPGDWFVRFIGTGALVASVEGVFQVKTPRVP